MVDFQHKHVHFNDHTGERPDSVELGTPARGGAVKVYFDASKPQEAEVLIAQAVHVAQTAAAIYKDSGLAKEAVK